MKNEDKIVELLAEMLKRQDRMEDELKLQREELTLQREELKLQREELQLQRGELKLQWEDNKESSQNMITTFNTGFYAMLDKLSSIDTKMGSVENEIRSLRQNDMRLTDHEVRIRRLEEERKAS